MGQNTSAWKEGTNPRVDENQFNSDQKPMKWRQLNKAQLLFYRCWEPLPKPIQTIITGALQGSAIVIVCIIAVLVASRVWPDKALNISWGDFKISSSAAKASADDAKKFAEHAEAAGKRIADIERKVERQRATIDAAFSDAADAKRTSGIATQTLAEARKSLQDMKNDAEFIDTVARAMSGYADAYDLLGQIPVDDSRFARAYNMKLFVEDNHAVWNAVLFKPPRFPARFGIAETNVTLRDVNLLFPKMSLSEQMEAVPFVKEQSRFALKEKLDFLYPQSTSNSNLRVRAAASRYYLDLIGVGDWNNPLGSQAFVREHWRTNTAGIK